MRSISIIDRLSYPPLRPVTYAALFVVADHYDHDLLLWLNGYATLLGEGCGRLEAAATPLGCQIHHPPQHPHRQRSEQGKIHETREERKGSIIEMLRGWCRAWLQWNRFYLSRKYSLGGFMSQVSRRYDELWWRHERTGGGRWGRGPIQLQNSPGKMSDAHLPRNFPEMGCLN